MKSIKEKYFHIFIVAAICIGMFFLLAYIATMWTFGKKILDIIWPWVIGGIIAYVLNPVCRFIERSLEVLFGRLKLKRHLEKILSILLGLCFALGLCYFTLAIIMPALTVTLIGVSSSLPS